MAPSVARPSRKPAPTSPPPSGSQAASLVLDWNRSTGVDDKGPLTPADTLLGLLDQILLELTFIPGLARCRKERLDKLLAAARATALIDEATRGVANPPTEPSGATSPPPPVLDRASRAELEATMKSLTQSAVKSFTEQATIAVKASIEAAFKASPLPTRSASHPPATATLPTAPHHVTPPRAKELEVVISLPDANTARTTRALSAAELKARVEAALTASGVEGLAGTSVHGVRRRSNGSVMVQADSELQAQLLLRHADLWVHHFASNAAIERKSYVVSAAAVPTTFDPRAPSAREAIFLSNQGTIPSPDAILSARWLHEHHMHTTTKTDATLVITLSDASPRIKAAIRLLTAFMARRGQERW
ncbi:hypothetical protein C8Q73DRAFT_667583 [Cubamyces lactineus]|nr:hypothetical protein C8Q73DRAFT_667583 [Cubamyces lactineus]